MKENQIKTGKIYKMISLFFLLALCLFWGCQKVWADDKVITDFSRIFYIPAGAMEVGQDLQELKEFYNMFGCTAYTEEGEEIFLNVNWDYSGIDTTKAGAYEINGTVKLPEGYTSKSSLPIWQVGISVQNKNMPEIHVYSRMISAGLYYFPWITDHDPDTMEIWMQKEGEAWVNVSEEGYGMCDTDGMYLSCQSMLPGNTYTLTVIYQNGKTRNLKYRYNSEGILDIISYQAGAVGEILQKDRTIRSVEAIKAGSLKRCAAFGLQKGQSVLEIKEELEETFHILGSTQEEYEDTAVHPSVVLPSVWDFSNVNTDCPGVYQVTGTFLAPEGYEIEEGVKMPEATAYISVQNPGQPEIQTCCMAGVGTLFFPMVLKRFTDQDIKEFQVWLKKGESEAAVDQTYWYVTGKGLYLRKEVLAYGQNYGVYVVYPGGSTGIYSFDYDENLITNDYWYERNYADRDGKELPDIDTGVERVTDTSTIIAGNRLAGLLQDGASRIPFEKDGVLVRISVDVIKQWNIKKDDKLQVDISREGESISVKINKNGNEIVDIPGSVIEIPDSSDSGEKTELVGGQGNVYTGNVNAKQNVTAISIDKTGEYLIENTKENDENQDDSQPEEGNSQEDKNLESAERTENTDNTENMENAGSPEEAGSAGGTENGEESESTEGIDVEENTEDSTEENMEENAEDKDMDDLIDTEATDNQKEAISEGTVENLMKQHPVIFWGCIVILSILLSFIAVKQGKKLRKGEWGEGEQRK